MGALGPSNTLTETTDLFRNSTEFKRGAE
jgi:hypothetical protein